MLSNDVPRMDSRGRDKKEKNMREIILASGSPRRKELLAQVGIAFQVIKSKAEEKITKTIPEEIVKDLSHQKAEDVAAGVEEGIVLGADTIVCLDHEIMGKPRDREEAYQMLEQLQGRSHSVFTGVTLMKKEAGQVTKDQSFAVETKVKVHAMSREEIEDYLDTGDPFDKAGGYGIQGPFAAYVDGIEGDYNNVVGLPIAAVYQELKQM